MVAADRIPCINPRCRRTAPAEKVDGEEIICGRCFRALPEALKRRYRQLRARERRLLRLVERAVARGTIGLERLESLRRAHERLGGRCWAAIRAEVAAPSRPAGLDGFLETMGLAR